MTYEDPPSRTSGLERSYRTQVGPGFPSEAATFDEVPDTDQARPAAETEFSCAGGRIQRMAMEILVELLIRLAALAVEWVLWGATRVPR
jgi:hypothetical protein